MLHWYGSTIREYEMTTIANTAGAMAHQDTLNFL